MNRIPLSVPNLTENEVKYVSEAINSGWVSGAGPYVCDFEQKFAYYTHIDAAVSCQSGTAALHLALLECGVRPGDFVIVPTLTFIASTNPIRYAFSDPVFMDCDDSLCIDPIKVEEFCTTQCSLNSLGELMHRSTGRRVSAILVVHIFGNMADMEAIMDTAVRYRLKVIEDATEALGTVYTSGRYSGRMAGTIGDVGAYSFNGNKIITTGGGGMVVCPSGEHLSHIRYLSTQAKNDEVFYLHNEIGYNYRMTSLQAALGLAQLERIEEFIHVKHRNYDIYQRIIGRNDRLFLLPFREETRPNKWFYSLHYSPEKTAMDIRKVVAAFDEWGVQTRAIWGLNHMQKPYLSSIGYKIEKALYYHEHIVNLPCSTGLSVEDAEKVARMAVDLLGGE